MQLKSSLLTFFRGLPKSGYRLAILLFVVLLNACTSLPEGIKPVKDFELQRYLGKWYEIARHDHSFERGLEQVTAQYSMRDDGGVKVINRGFNPEEQEWDEAIGKAYFVGEQNTGHLKVSFFGPFYASYVIFSLDIDDYGYAMITGPNRDYFWILARQPELEDDVLQRLLTKARDAGFDTEKLIFVNQ
ncbi:Lipocalin-like protein [Paraglaciecola sp. T6c]|uniref:lipocalin family protein n=1 Tax=Pseudoalteromonas atlantica (strain T6c / ATCC BAA-1087) TaxID=3042615 RepID=UPI00005C5977|nr:lipocalin family protein [Paraglaciecola sp. T6c]ABG39109.1 Lipocalin-like protein [Paraglaciecola sp. T6c]